MKTILHTYCFYDVSKSPDKENYENLCKKLKDMGLKKFHVLSEKSIFPAINDKFPIDLETNFLFKNQWNTSEESPNFKNTRVFDWFERANFENNNFKKGHWIEQTQEMIDIRYNTFKCGFCGNISYSEGFCDKCIESEYLSVKDLFLTKFVRICDSGKKKEEITKEEFNALFPKFLNEQLKRSKRTFLKQIEEEKEEIEKLMSASHIKIKGLEWLYGHDVILKQRVFFYNRTETFHFTVEDKEDVEIFGNSLKGMGFPYKYEVKCR
jgi:hypothetical protein